MLPRVEQRENPQILGWKGDSEVVLEVLLEGSGVQGYLAHNDHEIPSSNFHTPLGPSGFEGAQHRQTLRPSRRRGPQ